jgi:hypothetical protein
MKITMSLRPNHPITRLAAVLLALLLAVCGVGTFAIGTTATNGHLHGANMPPPVGISGYAAGYVINDEHVPVITLNTTANSRIGVWVGLDDEYPTGPLWPGSVTIAATIGDWDPLLLFNQTFFADGYASLLFFLANDSMQQSTPVQLWVNTTAETQITTVEAVDVQFSTSDGLDSFDGNNSSTGGQELVQDTIPIHDEGDMVVMGLFAANAATTITAAPSNGIPDQIVLDKVYDISGSQQGGAADVALLNNSEPVALGNHTMAADLGNAGNVWLSTTVAFDPPAVSNGSSGGGGAPVSAPFPATLVWLGLLVLLAVCGLLIAVRRH